MSRRQLRADRDRNRQKQELQHHEELRPSLPSVCQEDKTLLTEAPEGSTSQGAVRSERRDSSSASVTAGFCGNVPVTAGSSIQVT